MDAEIAARIEALRHDLELRTAALTREIELRAEQSEHSRALAFDAQQSAMHAALASAEKAVAAALTSQKEATHVQTETLRLRAEQQNEWRGANNDILLKAMPRVEAEQVALRMGERITEIAEQVQHAPSAGDVAALSARIDDARHQLDINRGLYMTRDDADRQHSTFISRLEGLEGWKANLTGRIAVFAFANTVVISVIVFIADYLLR